MSAYIAGLGTATPLFGISQKDSMELARDLSPPLDEGEHVRLMPTLYRRTTVQNRYSTLFESAEGPPVERQSFYAVAQEEGDRGPTTAARMIRYDSDAGPLAVAAARKALADARTAAREITHLVTVSCSGFRAPGFDITLIQELGLPLTISRTHVGFMGCHGALNALRVARAFAEADANATVLVCCVELCSLHHQYSADQGQIVANALFADGAAALICTGRKMEDRQAVSIVSNGATLIPNSTDTMQWEIGDHGFEMFLSSRVPDLICQHLQPCLESWLAKNGRSIADIGSWAIHPGGPRILSACAEAVGLPTEKLADSLQVLADYGNMSSPTVLFILQRLLKRGAPMPCVLLGFGPGLAVEMALVA